MTEPCPQAPGGRLRALGSARLRSRARGRGADTGEAGSQAGRRVLFDAHQIGCRSGRHFRDEKIRSVVLAAFQSIDNALASYRHARYSALSMTTPENIAFSAIGHRGDDKLVFMQYALDNI